MNDRYAPPTSVSLHDFSEQVLVLIVLYKQKPEESLAFKSIQNLPGAGIPPPRVLIYDNGPAASATEHPLVMYSHDPLNPGVGKAYNEGCRIAERLNRKWILLADQDTEFSPAVFKAFARAISKHPDIKLFAPVLRDVKGIVSPYRFVFGKGFRVKNAAPGIYSFSKRQVVNSAMLISIEAFRTAGGFDERFPLDLSDVVFCERFGARYPEFVIIDAVCRHSLSGTDAGRSPADDLDRFVLFTRAIRLYRKISTRAVFLSAAIVPRSIFLAMKHRSLKFIAKAWEA